MSIRKRLRDGADTELAQMLEKLHGHALQICGDGPIGPQELCQLAATNKPTSRAKAVTKLANAAEERLMQMLD